MANSKHLPPLQCFIFFEAAVRHQNFTAAAQELGTTQPAVSHRISLLEKDLGVPLFTRQHRGVSLTPDGTRLYDAVHESLGSISAAVEKIRSRRTRQVLTVATDFGFASYWLMPRMAALRKRMPDVDVRILTTQNTFDDRDFSGGVVDVAITFGAGIWPDCKTELLFPEIVIPVCSPAFLKQHALTGKVEDIAALPLLHLESVDENTHTARWTSWEKWRQLHQLPNNNDSQDLSLNNYPLVIQAAIAGQGLALGWVPLINDLLNNGQLVAAVTLPLKTERGYFLVQPAMQKSSSLLEQFTRWILEECKDTAQ